MPYNKGFVLAFAAAGGHTCIDALRKVYPHQYANT
jgi:hypothetical protein